MLFQFFAPSISPGMQANIRPPTTKQPDFSESSCQYWHCLPGYCQSREAEELADSFLTGLAIVPGTLMYDLCKGGRMQLLEDMAASTLARRKMSWPQVRIQVLHFEQNQSSDLRTEKSIESAFVVPKLARYDEGKN